MFRRAAAIAATVVLSATGVSAEPSSNERPANLRPAVTSVEAGLWDEMDHVEADAARSGERDTDPALNTYVRSVMCRLAPEYCGEVRVYIFDRPIFNATAAPNGYIEVWSGLLLRAQTEDELAFVLGHEITHFSRNHSLSRWNHQKATRNVMLALQIGVAAGAAAATYSAASSGSPYAQQSIDSISQAAQGVSDLIYLAGVARIFSYTREQETEADGLGFQRSKAAGYAPGASIAIWRSVVAETAASDFPSVRKSESRATIFDSHPVTADRIAALSRLAGEATLEPGAIARLKYRAAIRPHLDAWLRDDLRRRDFGQTLYILDRLAADGEDLGLINFYRGECFRLRRGEGDLKLAAGAYAQATAYADAPPAAWRELGEARRKTGDRAAARDALTQYLAKAPDAQDRWLVETTLKTLPPEGSS
jgi:predicted Zn-dependent protease